jgi:hypothetical protein
MSAQNRLAQFIRKKPMRLSTAEEAFAGRLIRKRLGDQRGDVTGSASDGIVVPARSSVAIVDLTAAMRRAAHLISPRRTDAPRR